MGTVKIRNLPDGIGNVLNVSKKSIGQYYYPPTCCFGYAPTRGHIGDPASAFNVPRQMLKLPICPQCHDTKNVTDSDHQKLNPIYMCKECNIEWGTDLRSINSLNPLPRKHNDHQANCIR